MKNGTTTNRNDPVYPPGEEPDGDDAYDPSDDDGRDDGR
jgi:hypothetical protein